MFLAVLPPAVVLMVDLVDFRTKKCKEKTIEINIYLGCLNSIRGGRVVFWGIRQNHAIMFLYFYLQSECTHIMLHLEQQWTSIVEDVVR